MHKDAQLLKKIPLFASLSNEDLGLLGGLLEPRVVPPNQAIFWIGEQGDQLFIVQYGQVRLSYTNEAGQEVTLGVVGAGAFFGDLSLLDGGPRTATAISVGDTGVWALRRDDFYRFLAQHPPAAQVMVATMATRLRENTEKLRGVKSVNEEIDETITPLQQLVDRFARLVSTGRFLLGVLTVVLAWIAFNTVLVWRDRERWREKVTFIDDPPTFFILGFVVTVGSFLLTVFILNSQRRQAERDRLQADFEYQVNLKAQFEIMQLHQKVDRLQETVAVLAEQNRPPDG